MNEAILPDIQRECETRMNADPFFQHITVVSYRKGDVSLELASALAGLTKKPATDEGRSGVCVLIAQPVGHAANHSVKHPPYQAIWTFVVMEYPPINDDPTYGTTARAEIVCRRLLDLFANFHPFGVTTPFIAETPFMEGVDIALPLGKDARILPVAYECRFRCTEARGRGLQFVVIPEITIGASSVSITCGTDAVDIYYTLDGSPPAPPEINPAATRYEAPFTPPFSCVIRAGAWRQQVGSDWTPSDIAWAEWDVSLVDNLNHPIASQAEGGGNLGV